MRTKSAIHGSTAPVHDANGVNSLRSNAPLAIQAVKAQESASIFSVGKPSLYIVLQAQATGKCRNSFFIRILTGGCFDFAQHDVARKGRKNGPQKLRSVFFCVICLPILAFDDGFGRACSRAGTARDAFVSVDLILAVACADRVDGAFSFAGAAANTFVGDYVCHKKLSPFLSDICIIFIITRGKSGVNR